MTLRQQYAPTISSETVPTAVRHLIFPTAVLLPQWSVTIDVQHRLQPLDDEISSLAYQSALKWEEDIFSI
ncbi:hypothetical protein ACS0TY_004106 [Phlomoides rotata]